MYKWLPALLLQASQTAADLHIGWIAELGSGASEADIVLCEEALSITLPLSYRMFLAKHNGARLGLNPNTPGAEPLGLAVRILSLVDMTLALKELRNLLKDEADLQDRFIPLASYGAEGDFVLADLSRAIDGEAIVIDGWHEIYPSWSDAVPLSNTFAIWLKTMLESFVNRHTLLQHWVNETETVATLRDPK